MKTVAGRPEEGQHQAHWQIDGLAPHGQEMGCVARFEAPADATEQQALKLGKLAFAAQQIGLCIVYGWRIMNPAGQRITFPPRDSGGEWVEGTAGEEKPTRQYAVAETLDEMVVVVEATSPPEAVQLAGKSARHLLTAPAVWVWWVVKGHRRFERVLRGEQ